MAAASANAGLWRTAFLSLRDEAMTTPTPPLPRLLEDLIFSQSHSLLSVAPLLPPHELTSDCVFLLDLISTSDDPDRLPVSLHACQLIHDVCGRVHLQFSSSSWDLFLHSLANLLDFLSSNSTAQLSKIQSIMQSLETLRRLTASHHRNHALVDDIHTVKFLLRVIQLLHQDMVLSYNQVSRQRSTNHDHGKKLRSRQISLWDTLALSFDMLGQAMSMSKALLPLDVSQSAAEVLRKVMDVLVCKGQLSEDCSMLSFYSSLLHCLHLVLADIKSSVSDHVSTLVAALRMFFCYGLAGPTHLHHSDVVHKDNNYNNTPYRPPHLRKKNNISIDVITSSDSDMSDGERSSTMDSSYGAEVRVTAIACIQDLCRADSKSFTSQWTSLLPTSDVLKPRRFEANLMTCLLFDPRLKVRIASATAIATMMDGPSSIFLQVAEYKESTKYGSFMPLSNSLGLILMQLHAGILHLIHSDNHGRLLASLFKILSLLISSTPYSRMPGDLLPSVIISLRTKIKEGFPFKNDQTGLLVSAIGCLTAAFSTSPPLMQMQDMLSDEISTGEGNSGILSTLFRFAEQSSNTPTRSEALQVLRAIAHNYPALVSSCWERVSAIVYRLLVSATAQRPPPVKDSDGYIGDKIITMAVKVLDECLRAISGFKGTEDLLVEDRILQTPFTSDFIRSKKVSSAPSYGLERPNYTREEGCDQWSEAISKHIPMVLHHDSPMVRGASILCFAGITSSVFVSLKRHEQDFITSSTITAALHDNVPSVRSAACRAIGVMSCFQETSRSAEIHEKFILAVESNTRDPLISVRITASWALANICDSLRYCVKDSSFNEGSNTSTQFMGTLIECALRLTEDGDKVKSNAVRALGSLSRHIKLSRGPTLGRDSDWLERTVQAFLSCVTTGNVKVQWNVCHAISNLFSNETIKLQDVDWSPTVFSILLLLLRDASNFKIRIQAAAALAVPATSFDYGRSFLDVVKGVEHALECLSSDKETRPENFKYKTALEKQLASTMLHLLCLLSSDHTTKAMTSFLIKKAVFLEEWLKKLSASSMEETGSSNGGSSSRDERQKKKELISKAIQSLGTCLELEEQCPQMASKLQQLYIHI